MAVFCKYIFTIQETILGAGGSQCCSKLVHLFVVSSRQRQLFEMTAKVQKATLCDCLYENNKYWGIDPEKEKSLDVMFENNNPLSYDPDEECGKLVRKIRYLIEAKGMSIYNTAERAGISPSTLNELLHKRSRPQMYTLFKLCNALEVSLEDIFGVETGELETDEEKLLLSYRYLPSWKREKLNEYIEMLIQYEPSNK